MTPTPGRAPGCSRSRMPQPRSSHSRTGWSWWAELACDTIAARQCGRSAAVTALADGMLLSYPTPEPDRPVLPTHGPRWPLTLTDHGDWALHNPDTGHTRYFVDRTPAGVTPRMSAVSWVL